MITIEKIETPEQMVRELEQNNLVLLLDRDTSTIGVLFDIHCIRGDDIEYRTRFGILWRKSRVKQAPIRRRLIAYAEELLATEDGPIPFLLTIKIDTNDRKASGRAFAAAKSLLEGGRR
jgi:hypothetical protein